MNPTDSTRRHHSNEKNTVTVALNCSVKVSGSLYAPDDVIRVPESIARRLVEQKAADLYKIPAEGDADPEVEEIEPIDEPEGDDEKSERAKAMMP